MAEKIQISKQIINSFLFLVLIFLYNVVKRYQSKISVELTVEENGIKSINIDLK